MRNGKRVENLNPYQIALGQVDMSTGRVQNHEQENCRNGNAPERKINPLAKNSKRLSGSALRTPVFLKTNNGQPVGSRNASSERGEGGSMTEEVYCLARTEGQAHEIIEKVKR